jgi:hypothetical protein
MLAEGSLPYSRPDQQAGRLAAAAVALGIAILLSFAPQVLNDGDTGWHLATGRFILENRAIPAADPFSFTARGTPWTAHEWLAEVIMAALYAAGGWPLLAMTLAALVGGLMLVIGFELARWLNPLKIVAALVLVIMMLMPSMLIRPHAFAWLLLAVWTVILLHAREADRPPPLATALLMLVWANLHGSFIIGLVIAGVFGLEALVTASNRRSVLIGWGIFGAASLGAALLTPHGINGLTFPLMVNRMATLGLITEWQTTDFRQQPWYALPFLVTLFVLLWRGVRVPPLRLLLLCLLVYMAMAHIRHQQVLAIVGSLLLAAPLGLAFGARVIATPSRRLAPALLLGLGVAVLARIVLAGSGPAARPNASAALAAVPPALRQQPVINEYGYGGWLIFAGIAPYIDGRADMYGDDFMRSYRRISDGDIAALNRAAAKYGARWTIFKPTTPIVARLDADPGWQRQYSDRWAVVHVRKVRDAPAG